MRAERLVLLLVPSDWSYGRQIITGIHQYAKPAKPWAVTNPKRSSDRAVNFDFYRTWGISGLIVMSDYQDVLSIAESDVIPTVWIEQTPRQIEHPQHAVVGIDIPAIAEMAVDHFVTRGYRSFGVFGRPAPDYARPRLPALAEAATATGADVDIFDAERDYAALAPTFPHVNTGWERVHQWLVALPKPVAVLTADDRAAVICSEICRRTGLQIPEEVAVLGVGNDQMYCNLAYPPLSSVQVPGEQLGFLAANLLERLMNGDALNSQEVRLPPTGIATRMSTDTLAIDDEAVGVALRFIRDHAHEPIGVEDLMGQVRVSRRVLEQKFQKFLGRGPYAEIQRQRIDHVRQLLAETDLTLEHIAERCGYNSVNRMGAKFRQVEGVTPGAYRKRFRPQKD